MFFFEKKNQKLFIELRGCSPFSNNVAIILSSKLQIFDNLQASPQRVILNGSEVLLDSP